MFNDYTAFDDLTSSMPDVAKVIETRNWDMVYYKRVGVYDKVPLEECWKKTGKAPLKARWVDVDKGPRYRSRWTGKEFKNSEVEERFAPPWMALRLMVSPAMTSTITHGHVCVTYVVRCTWRVAL